MAAQNTINLLNEKGIDFLTDNNIDAKYISDKDVYVLNYQQIETNRNSEYRKYHPVVRECRNLIIRKNSDNTYSYISRSFERFFNYLEHKEETELFINAMKSKEVTAYEKVDGSLIQVTYFDKQWHIFTRGTDADTNPFRGSAFMKPEEDKSTFGSRVRTFIKNFDKLNTNYIYIFELCTPLAHVTKYDKEKLVLLTIIERSTNQELHDETQDAIAFENNWAQPEVFYPSSIDDVYSRMAKKPKDFEGYVLKYKSMRMKVKTESYVTLHHLGSKINTVWDLVRIVVEGEYDEASVVLLPYKKYLDLYKTILDQQYTIIEDFWAKNYSLSRKDFALATKSLNSPLSWILYNIKDGKFDPKFIRCIFHDKPANEKEQLIAKITNTLERSIKDSIVSKDELNQSESLLRS